MLRQVSASSTSLSTGTLSLLLLALLGDKGCLTLSAAKRAVLEFGGTTLSDSPLAVAEAILFGSKHNGKTSTCDASLDAILETGSKDQMLILYPGPMFDRSALPASVLAAQFKYAGAV